MRLSILPILIAGASVVNLVAAEPLRVIEDPSNANDNIRFGHALANANVNGNDDNVAHIVRPAVPMNPPQAKIKGFAHHLCGASLREKALHLSNAFRHALGMPLIEADLAMPRPGRVHVIPVGFPSVVLHKDEDDEGKRPHHPGHHHEDEDHEHHPHHGHHGHHRHHGHHGHHGHHHKSFLKRIHRAIKALGPWEGRAVSFVLGCGIGVLLRMFWVLSVLAYRTIRGERSEEPLDREYIVYEQVPEPVYLAPPQYVDEKIKVEVDENGEERK